MKNKLAILTLFLLLPAMTVKAQEEVKVRSIYTNEIINFNQSLERPIAVMMPTDKEAQPSFGIGEADILYEIMEEGNISRQLAIIPDWKNLEQIGNIRSCRLYYIPEATEWDPILIHFGGVFYMQDRISSEDINNLSGTYEYGGGGDMPGADFFYRSRYKKAPHNAYINGERIIHACAALNYTTNIREDFYNPKHFIFAEKINNLAQYEEGTIEAKLVDLSPVFPYSCSSFYYNEENGLYYKMLHNRPQVDGLTGKQLTFSNIIIQNTKWGIYEDGQYLFFQNIDDTENGFYITKGKCIPIYWKKTSDYSPTIYYDTYGNEIELNTGKTYIAVAQKGRVPIIK